MVFTLDDCFLSDNFEISLNLSSKVKLLPFVIKTTSAVLGFSPDGIWNDSGELL